MTESTLSLARTGDEDAFRELTDPYRRDLHLHCHRILGSVQDAEDMVQETLVAAWRGLERYEERGSLRAWLYRIATNRCLNELRERGRRPREAPGLPFEVPEPTRRGEQLWLEPYPDQLLEGITESSLGPESRYETKEAVTLAFVAALQHLPPRQRAVLVLRDVLGFHAAEVAEMLESSEVSVNSALQRARATLESRRPADRERAPLPRSPGERELVSRFAEAVESGDVEGMVSLLTDDAPAARVPGTRGDRRVPQIPGAGARHATACRAHPGQHPAGLRLLHPGRGGSDRRARRTVRADARGERRLGDDVVRRSRPLRVLRASPDAALVGRAPDGTVTLGAQRSASAVGLAGAEDREDPAAIELDVREACI